MELLSFITAFTLFPHLSLFWARSIQSMSPHFTSLRSILILASYLHVSLTRGLFLSGYHPRTLYAPLPHTCYIPRPSHYLWFNRPNDIWWRVQVTDNKFQIYWRNFAHERTDTHAEANWHDVAQIFTHPSEINASWVTADLQHVLLIHVVDKSTLSAEGREINA